MPAANDKAIVIAPSINGDITQALTGMHDSLMKAAKKEVERQYADQQFTAMEKKAVVAVEALRLLNGWDLAALLERGRIIKDIEDGGLVGVFPGDYHSLEEIAIQVGISRTEVSDTRTLYNIIFPWLEENSGQTVAFWWDQIGKSKFRELVPVLKTLITGEATTDVQTVAASVRHLLEQTQMDAEAAGEALNPDEVRDRTIERVLEVGQLPTREMRNHIRPGGTPNLNGVRIKRDDHDYVVLKVTTPEQDRMLGRLLGHHADVNEVDPTPEITRTLERLLL